MSLEAARIAIENVYSCDPINGAAIGYDGHEFELQDATIGPSIQLTIQSGEATQASLGSPSTNLARTAGVAFFKIWTEGGKGSRVGNETAQTIIDMYTNKRLDSVKTGIPYLVPVQNEEPHTVHLVSVPYVREDYNA